MDTYEIELEPAEPDGFAATVPAVPGLLLLGSSVDEVLERARAAIAFHVGRSDGFGCAQLANLSSDVKSAPRGG